MHAVAESTRNVSCVGARPLAITNCLNFGNPEKPAGYYQLDRATAGMAAACAGLGVPVVSGNVSLYNETAASAVMPTPTVGAVGVIDNLDLRATMVWNTGDALLVLNGQALSLGASEYLQVRHGLVAGRPPALDLQIERTTQALVQSLIAEGIVRTAHDVSEGGLAVAVAEMAIVSGTGVELDSIEIGGRVDENWFGESASTIVIACEPAQISTIASRAETLGISVRTIGTTGGHQIRFNGTTSSIDLSRAASVYELGLAAFA
jgi:phosphoribosylformylglycinamidine synthase